MIRTTIIALALLAAAPAYAFDSGIRTWDGTECLIDKTGEIVPCDKWMLDAIDRDVAHIRERDEENRKAAVERFEKDAAYWRAQQRRR